MKTIFKYVLILAGVWVVYVVKVWAARTGFPLLTAAGYVLIAGAVLGLLGYVLKPEVRTIPPHKFFGPLLLLLAFGIAGVALDSVKKARTSSVSATNTVEPAASPPKDVAGLAVDDEKKVKDSSVPLANTAELSAPTSQDREILAQVIHEFRDAFTRRGVVVDLWNNLLKANAEKQEMETSRLSMLNSMSSQHNEQCERLIVLSDKTRLIKNNEAQKKSEAALNISLNRCKIITETIKLTFEALSPEFLEATGGNVGSVWYSVMKLQNEQLSESKKRESDVLPLLISALTALGMNPDLKSY